MKRRDQVVDTPVHTVEAPDSILARNPAARNPAARKLAILR